MAKFKSRRRVAASITSALVASLAIGCGGSQWVPSTPNARGVASTRQGNVELLARVAHRPELPLGFSAVQVTVHNRDSQSISVALDEIVLAGPKQVLGSRAPGSLRADQATPTIGINADAGVVSQGGVPVGQVLAPGRDVLDAQQRTNLERGAFVGGLIVQGGVRSGYVYFGPMPGDIGPLTLQVPVHAEPGGARLTILEIPFVFKR